MVNDPKALITALICTRNRGASITGAIASILANVHPNFELVVIDQSTNDETAEAVRQFCSDPRLHYLRSDTQGLGRAHNIGLSIAHGEIVAITDDDCEVPAHWLETMALAFMAHPNVAVAFCNVDPIDYDRSAGFIPVYQRTGTKLLTGTLDKCKARGIGAGIAVRKPFILALGGFDEMLGPGAVFPSCDDGDMAVRALLNGYQVYETDAVAVVHAGFRTWEEGKKLARRDFFAIGAAYAKPLKCGHWRFLVVPVYELGRHAIWPPVVDLLCLRRPRGLGRIGAFLQGFVRGWQTPVDPKTLLFRSSDAL